MAWDSTGTATNLSCPLCEAHCLSSVLETLFGDGNADEAPIDCQSCGMPLMVRRTGGANLEAVYQAPMVIDPTWHETEPETPADGDAYLPEGEGIPQVYRNGVWYPFDVVTWPGNMDACPVCGVTPYARTAQPVTKTDGGTDYQIHTCDTCGGAVWEEIEE